MCLTKNEEPGREASERRTALFSDESMICEEGRRTGMSVDDRQEFYGTAINQRSRSCRRRLQEQPVPYGPFPRLTESQSDSFVSVLKACHCFADKSG